MNYRELTKKLKLIDFRLYAQGVGSYELWIRARDGKIVPVPKENDVVEYYLPEVPVSLDIQKRRTRLLPYALC